MQVPKSVDNEQVSSVGITLSFVHEVKGLIGCILTLGISASPSPLLELQDKLIGVLKDRMINCADLSSS